MTSECASLVKDIMHHYFFEHLPRKLTEKRDLKCHRGSILKSISSFCKSCNNHPNRCARTFRVSQSDNYGHRAGLRLRSFALQNRWSERLTKGSGTASSVLDLLAIRASAPYFFIKSIAFRNYTLYWTILKHQIIAECITMR